MKRFWISWICTSEDYRPLTFPPNPAILGWWCSGSGDDGVTLCALVAGSFESEVRDAVLKDWPEALEHHDWRFFEERPNDYVPGDRFPLTDWMRERLTVSV